MHLNLCSFSLLHIGWRLQALPALSQKILRKRSHLRCHFWWIGLFAWMLFGNIPGIAQGPTPPVPSTFSYNGTNGTDGSAQTYTVPTGIYSLSVIASGAAGADVYLEPGGKGGKVEALLKVTPGQTLTIYIGGNPPQGTFAGYNGGGKGSERNSSSLAGGGGGATDIRLDGNDLANRILVAGGGGGGSLSRIASPKGAGAGGGLTGGMGDRGRWCGSGGTQSAGGEGGIGRVKNGNPGTLGIGGDGFVSSLNGYSYVTGAGGGGYYGGGSGGNDGDYDGDGGLTGSGGGGSSYTDPTYVTQVTHTQGDRSGNGEVTIVPIPEITLTTSVTPNPICAGGSVELSVTASGGMAPYSYTWTAPTGITLSGTSTSAVSASVEATVSGVQTLTITVASLNGVPTSTSLVTVTVNSLPMVSISPSSTSLCAGESVMLTASGGQFYRWSTQQTTAAISAMTTGSYSVTVTDGNTCSNTATVQVTVKDPIPAPTFSGNLMASSPGSLTVIENTPYVTLTAGGCAGRLVWSGFYTGSGTTVSVPTSATGTRSYSVVCQQEGCNSPPASFTVEVIAAPVAGSFDGFVNGADCSTFRGWAWDRNKVNTAVSVDILDGAKVIGTLLADVFRQDLQTAGKGNGKHAFSWSIPAELKDGLAHNLTARVSGSSFILKDSPKALICQGSSTPTNKAPVPPSPTVLIAPLSAQVGVPFSGTLVAFTDPENQPLTYALTGLPGGLSINSSSRVISGIPNEAGTFVLTYSASDGTLTNSVSFPLTVNPTSTTTVTGDFEGYLDKLDCGGIRGWVWDRKKPNTPLTVEFYREGTGEVLGSAVANIFRQDLKDAGKGNGAHAYNFTPPGSVTSGTLIRARVLGSTYELKGGAKSYQCAPARLSAESSEGLQVTVLGNPVSDQVHVEVRGAEGQPLRFQLTDISGRLISQRQIEVAKPVEQQTLSVQQQSSGLLFLRVSSGSKSLTLKVVKQ